MQWTGMSAHHSTVSGVNIPGQGQHNVFHVATEHDTIYAFDADNTNGLSGGGAVDKRPGAVHAVTTIAGVYTNKNFGCRYNNGASTPDNSGQYTDIVPSVSVTGTPVIDARLRDAVYERLYG